MHHRVKRNCGVLQRKGLRNFCVIFWSCYNIKQYKGNCLFQQIVNVALAEVGQSNGEKYWSWYGFSSYQEWCACFVSWCGDGVAEHVAIVAKCEGGIVYTVEGNTSTTVNGNSVRGVWQHQYSIGSENILGYGSIEQ